MKVRGVDPGKRGERAKEAARLAGIAKRLNSYVPTILILLVLLSATSIATWIILAAASDRARQHFNDQVSAVETHVADAMRSYKQVLRAGVAAVNVLPSITREQWRLFVSDATVDDFYPAIRGVGFVKSLLKSEIDEFVEKQRREGRPDFQFHPVGERELYTTIVYLEPDDAGNRKTLGYDMFSEPRRRAAMEKARDSGLASISQKVKLMQVTVDDSQAGTLVFLPVYADGVVPKTVEARRMALHGYVYGAFRMKDFTTSVLDRNLPNRRERLHIRIYDGAGTSEASLLYDDQMLTTDLVSQPAQYAERPRFSDRREILIAGAPWTLVVGSKPGLEEMIDRSLAWTVLFGGILVSVLIAGIFAYLAYAGERFANAERALSEEVAERKRAEERAQIANRELIHRVKNMLAIVTAIASQTARYSPTVAAFNIAFRERLTAMARVQDLLRPDPAHSPDLGSFARDILEPYCANRPTALTTSGPYVALTQQDAVLLSLLINELATNAIKYGAWSVPSGRVSLQWQEMTTDEDLPEVEIVWQEFGGPVVVPPSSSGFGTNVMKFAIERGMRGSIVTSFDPAGIRHEVRLPRTSEQSEPEPEPDHGAAFEGES